jgi:hypothetical protein
MVVMDVGVGWLAKAVSGVVAYLRLRFLTSRTRRHLLCSLRLVSDFSRFFEGFFVSWLKMVTNDVYDRPAGRRLY